MSDGYEKRTDDEGIDVACDCCGYPAPVSDFGFNSKFNVLCEVCSATFLSHAIEYPDQIHDPKLYKSVGWIANKLIDEIRALRTP